MPSGTMANLASILAHCPRGSKILVGDESDIFIYEAGGAAICGGIIYEPAPTQPNGCLMVSDLENACPDFPDDPQYALASLICLENTHNRCGGRVLPLAYLQKTWNFAHSKGLPIHMDGARIFNASVALNVSPATIARYADLVQFCLSKGLAAPVGSIVVGSDDFIYKVRRVRKMLGGGCGRQGLLPLRVLLPLTK